MATTDQPDDAYITHRCKHCHRDFMPGKRYTTRPCPNRGSNLCCVAELLGVVECAKCGYAGCEERDGIACKARQDGVAPIEPRDAENESGEDEDGEDYTDAVIAVRKSAICKYCGLNVWMDLGNGPIILRTCHGTRPYTRDAPSCIAGEPVREDICPMCLAGEVDPASAEALCQSCTEKRAKDRPKPFLKQGFHGRVERDYYREVYLTTLKAIIHEAGTHPVTAAGLADKAARAAVEHYRQARGW